MTRLILQACDPALSASSAALSAKKRRTIVVSSDPTRALSEYLSEIGEVGHKETKLAEDLYAMELDIQNELDDRWKEFESIIGMIPGASSKGVNSDEAAILPSMETLVLLLRLEEMLREKKYGMIILHFPSPEKILDLLMIPSNGMWYYDVYSPGIERTMKLARLARGLIPMPDPDAVLRKMREYQGKFENAGKHLDNPEDTSARFEIDTRYPGAARNLFAYLALFGINADAVFAKREMQFAAKTIVIEKIPDEKPGNVDELASIAKPFPDDPASFFRLSKPFRFLHDKLEIDFEYGTASDLSVYQSKYQLAIRYKAMKRSIFLPDEMRDKNVESAQFKDGKFTITFA